MNHGDSPLCERFYCIEAGGKWRARGIIVCFLPDSAAPVYDGTVVAKMVLGVDHRSPILLDLLKVA